MLHLRSTRKLCSVLREVTSFSHVDPFEPVCRTIISLSDVLAGHTSFHTSLTHSRSNPEGDQALFGGGLQQRFGSSLHCGHPPHQVWSCLMRLLCRLLCRQYNRWDASFSCRLFSQGCTAAGMALGSPSQEASHSLRTGRPDSQAC